MNSIKIEIENKVLVMYLRHKFNVLNRRNAKNVSWIKRQALTKLVKEHCNALMHELLNNKNYSFREKKFIIDNILNTSFEKGLSHLKANAQINSIKPILHLNSYIIYEEFLKGIKTNKSNKNVKYSINKELMLVSEELTKKSSADELLEEKIGV